jgi:hypothetical protein
MLPAMNRQHYDHVGGEPEVNRVRKAPQHGPTCFVVDARKRQRTLGDPLDEGVQLL